MKYEKAGEAELKQQHLVVQEEIAKLPVNQQKTIRDQQRLVDELIVEQNEIHFSDTRFALDKFLSTHGIGGGFRSHFVDKLKNTPRGKTFTFPDTHGNFNSFYRTLDDNLMAANDYIYTLEASVMSTNRKLKESNNNFTHLKLYDRIKLAINIILKGGING